MKKKLTVRRATIEDVPQIHSIIMEAFAKYAHDLEQPHRVEALKESEDDIIQAMSTKTVLVALLDGEPVGTVRFQVKQDTAYFSRFGVRFMAQGLGVGTALCDAVEKRCRALNLKAIMLHTSSRMAGLVRFYYGQGYFVHSTSTDRGYVRALMVRELEYEGTLDLDRLQDRYF